MKASTIVILVVIAVALGGGIWYFTRKKDDASSSGSTSNNPGTKDSESILDKIKDLVPSKDKPANSNKAKADALIANLNRDKIQDNDPIVADFTARMKAIGYRLSFNHRKGWRYSPIA